MEFVDLKLNPGSSCCCIATYNYITETYSNNDELQWTNKLFFIKIYLSHFIQKGWCWLCVRGELETDCHILTPSSSDHSSTFVFWLGCSTRVTEGPRWSWFSFWHLYSNWNSNCLELLKPSVAPGYIIDAHLLPMGVHICTEFNHIHGSKWYSDTFDRMHPFRLLIDGSVEG